MQIRRGYKINENDSDSIFSNFSEEPEEQEEVGEEEEAAMSFATVRQVTRPEIQKGQGRKFIITARQIDKFTTIRKREVLTPSRCTVYGCNFDIAKFNGFENGWTDVPRREHRMILEALQEHVKVAHNKSEDHIIEEKEMPTRWLGSERGLKGI